MANDNAVVSWTANDPSEGVTGYTVYWGMVSGTWTSADITTATTLTITDDQFSSDGNWYFAVDAFDAADNHSVTTTPVSKRIVRTGNRLIVRK